jgi:hypothetical protein
MATEKSSLLDQFPHLSEAEKLQLKQLLVQDGQLSPMQPGAPSFSDVFGTKANPLNVTADLAKAGHVRDRGNGESMIEGMVMHSHVRLLDGSEVDVNVGGGTIWDGAGDIIDPSAVSAFKNAGDGTKWIDVKHPARSPAIAELPVSIEEPRGTQPLPSAPEIPHYENEVEGEGLAFPTRPKAIPEDVLNRTTRKGNRYLDANNPSRTMFVDYGSKLQTPQGFDGHAVRSMVAVAEARGWHSIKVSGSEDFRRAVYMEAATRGLEVSGYKPTDAEKAAAEKAAGKNGNANKIEENPMVKAYRASQTPEDRKDAAKQHPNLKNAYALESALTRFAEQRLQPGAREAFIERSKQNIAADLAAGVSFNDVLVRKTPQTNRPARSRTHEAEQSH